MRLMPNIRLLIETEVGRPPAEGISLKNLSNFKIGGLADFFFEARTPDELKKVLSIARKSGIRYDVIGGGFNLLFDDSGYRGLIIRNACRGVEFNLVSGRLSAFGGTPLEDLTALCRKHGLAGLEFLAGIPGTVGGAVYGNAGAFGRSVGEILTEALLLDVSGNEKRAVSIEEFEFGYRDSRLKKTGDIVLSADFQTRPGEAAAVSACMDSYLALRAERHPSRDMAYAGSYFKNPLGSDGKRLAAGKLLEQAGAKQMTVGGAAVYEGHGNFLYNRGGATAADVRQLAAVLKARVKDHFGVELEEEVIFLPAEPSGA